MHQCIVVVQRVYITDLDQWYTLAMGFKNKQIVTYSKLTPVLTKIINLILTLTLAAILKPTAIYLTRYTHFIPGKRRLCMERDWHGVSQKQQSPGNEVAGPTIHKVPEITFSMLKPQTGLKDSRHSNSAQYFEIKLLFFKNTCP